jgi:tetratricopeptide (TPR) repeat protein
MVMQDCPKVEQLLRWLNGLVDEAIGIEFADHVADCNDCQTQLEKLSDSSTLKPSDGGDLLDASTFTNEPHFKSLRKSLPKKLGELRSDDPRRDEDRGPNGLQNALIDVADESEADVGTVDANFDATPVLDQQVTSLYSQDAISESLQQSFAAEGYLLEGLIGRGGFAHVFQAWEKSLERSVAIKVLDQSRFDPRNLHRFLREAKTASSIDSPNVVRVLTSGETSSGRPFIVMELVHGQSLAQWIQVRFDKNQMDADAIKQGASLLVQGCNGAQAIHDAALVHRDIKPGNIFVEPEKLAAKIGDFGLARVLDSDTVTLTRAEELAGTPAYMSPEQTLANGEVDSLSDVYSLGASLYQILTGQPPFRGSSLAILKQVNEVQPVSPRLLNENVSQDFETICLKALEKDPKQRYASASELATDLQRAIDGKPIEARPATRFQILARWAKANRSLATALGLLFLSMLVGTIVSSAMWYRASIAEKQAVDDREAILMSMNHLVVTVFEDLGDNAATIKARESVLQAAIDGLDSIAEVGTDAEVDRPMMIANQRLGGMMNFKGDPEGEKYFLQAVELGRSSHEASPTNQTAYDLACALNYLTEHYELFQSKADDREALAMESKLLIEEALVAEPNNPRFLYQSLKNDAVRFDSLHAQPTAAWATIVEESPPVLEKVERILSLPREGNDSNDIARDIYFHVGRAHFQCRDFENAKLYFGLSREQLEEALTVTPNNLKLIEHRAVLDRISALIATESGNHPRAVELVSLSIDSLKTLVDDDPENASRQQQLANSYSMLAKSLRFSGKYTEALEAFDKSHAINKVLLAKNPNDNTLRLLTAAGLYYERGASEILLNRWDDTKESYSSVIHYLSGPKFGPPVSGLEVEHQLNMAMLTVNALKLADGEEGADRNPTSECIALLYLARRGADTSTSDQLSKETLAVVKNINPEIEATTWVELFEYVNSLEGLSDVLLIYRQQIEGRCWGLKARNLADDSSSSEKCDECTNKSLKILIRLAADFPHLKTNLILNEPDFIWLRQTGQYKESGIGMD